MMIPGYQARAFRAYTKKHGSLCFKAAAHSFSRLVITPSGTAGEEGGAFEFVVMLADCGCGRCLVEDQLIQLVLRNRIQGR